MPCTVHDKGILETQRLMLEQHKQQRQCHLPILYDMESPLNWPAPQQPSVHLQ